MLEEASRAVTVETLQHIFDTHLTPDDHLCLIKYCSRSSLYAPETLFSVVPKNKNQT